MPRTAIKNLTTNLKNNFRNQNELALYLSKSYVKKFKTQTILNEARNAQEINTHISNYFYYQCLRTKPNCLAWAIQSDQVQHCKCCQYKQMQH